MKPLYMWAGGKSKMIPKYLAKPGIPLSGYDTYVEPFFGGGAMMIYIHENNPQVKRFVLNDINTEIVGLYRAIKNDVITFISHIDLLENQYLPLDKAARKIFYYKIRKEYSTAYAGWTPTQESATLYFLMKTAFNGIWQSTKEAKGRFCTPCGLLTQTTAVYDRANVLEWNKFLQKVDIYSGDWKSCCDKVTDKAFFFFDPPYRDSFTQYGQVFSDVKQLEVIDFCRQANIDEHLVMFCNRDAGDSFYTDNQGLLTIDYYKISYTAGRRATDSDGVKSAKAATEVLMHNIVWVAAHIPAPVVKIKKSRQKKIITNPLFVHG